jgi:hypothetical protein
LQTKNSLDALTHNCNNTTTHCAFPSQAVPVLLPSLAIAVVLLSPSLAVTWPCCFNALLSLLPLPQCCRASLLLTLDAANPRCCQALQLSSQCITQEVTQIQ